MRRAATRAISTGGGWSARLFDRRVSRAAAGLLGLTALCAVPSVAAPAPFGDHDTRIILGAWIVRDGIARDIAGWKALLLIPCLVLTFLFGPAGLLLYLLLRLVFRRRPETAS